MTANVEISQVEHIYETFPKAQLTRESSAFAKVTAQPTAKSYKQANFKQQFQLSPELSAVIECLTTQ